MSNDDKQSKHSEILNRQTSQANMSSLNGIKENEKKVDIFLKNCVCEDEDQDEKKQMSEQINFLKKQIKELESKLKHLEEQIKELIKNVKYEPIIKPQIVQILQLLGFSPQNIQIIVSKKLSGLKNFNL